MRINFQTPPSEYWCLTRLEPVRPLLRQCPCRVPQLHRNKPVARGSAAPAGSAGALTMDESSVRLPKMARTGKPTKRNKAGVSASSRSRKILKSKEDTKVAAHAEAVRQ